jgi:hypothetical protein
MVPPTLDRLLLPLLRAELAFGYTFMVYGLAA